MVSIRFGGCYGSVAFQIEVNNFEMKVTGLTRILSATYTHTRAIKQERQTRKQFPNMLLSNKQFIYIH